MENKAFTQIFYDILGKVLQLSENPSQFAEYLTQQIRELIGTRTVVIAVKPETEPVKIFSVFPVRRTEWANQSAVIQLAVLTTNFETIQYLDKGKSEKNIALLLESLEIDKAIAIPLIAANRIVGSILLLDIMDEFGNESVIDLLNRLSGVFALVIRNSYLYQNMEDLVALRTEELQNQNLTLLKREQELIVANEEYEVLNEELTENISEAEELNKQLITANKRAEKSEMQARDILQTAMDSFWIIDMNGKFIDVNDITCKTLGYTREEMLTMSIADIEVIEDVEQTNRRIRKIIETGEDRFESKHRCKNGRIIDVEVSVKMQPFQNLMVTFAHDITSRKQVVAELTRSEERFNLAIKASNDGLFDWNLETNDIYYSPAWKKMLGYEDHELANDFSVWENTTEPEDVKKSWELQKKLISKEIDRFVLEFKMKHKDGYWVDILSQAEAIFNDSGKAIRIVGTHSNITERKLAEQELIIAKEHAEESDRLKSAFLANMSHEIRTPMNSIMGFASLLPEEESKELMCQYANIIVQNSEQLLSLIDSIVLYSKLQSGLIVYKPTLLEVPDFLNDIQQSFNLPLYQKGVNLKLEFNIPEKTQVCSDYDKLRQIVANLVVNAFKYTPKGDITLGCVYKNEWFEFYVRDTGIGIPQKDIAHIFERFYRGSNIDEAKSRGTGLGLSIVKELVEMLGGKIWVESVEGIGSTFYFTIPVDSM